jgi:hypothetical protein
MLPLRESLADALAAYKSGQHTQAQRIYRTTLSAILGLSETSLQRFGLLGAIERLRDFDSEVNRLITWANAIARVRLTYRKTLGRELELFAPKRFTEKMQWRKLFDLNPIYATCCDKLAVRNFISVRVGTDYLIPLLCSGSDPYAIQFHELKPPYVIKSTHASAHVLRIRQHSDIGERKIRPKLERWLWECYATQATEPGYLLVPRRIIIEQMLADSAGVPPVEHRIFVFHGKVKFIQTTLVENDQLTHGAYHDIEWNPLPWYLQTPNRKGLSRPKRLEELIRIAERLGNGFDHVRIDLYSAAEQIWIGEMTVYSWGGLRQFTPDDTDFLVGSYWTIDHPLERALNTVLHSSWEIPGDPRIISPPVRAAAQELPK